MTDAAWVLYLIQSLLLLFLILTYAFVGTLSVRQSRLRVLRDHLLLVANFQMGAWEGGVALLAANRVLNLLLVNAYFLGMLP